MILLFNKQQELIKLRELSRLQEEHGHNFGRRERHDSTDSIEDSMEIKRLRSEISKLQAECQHWKSIANGVVSRKPSNSYVCAHTQKRFVLVTYVTKCTNSFFKIAICLLVASLQWYPIIHAVL